MGKKGFITLGPGLNVMKLFAMLIWKARSQLKSWATERCKHYISLQKPAWDKHLSLLQTFINYRYKNFYNIGPWYGVNLPQSTVKQFL